MASSRFGSRLLAGGVALALLLAACGDDDDGEAGESGSTSEETATTAAEEGGGEEAGGELEELCALAEEMFTQEDFPTAEQVQQYQELAPEEIADAVAVAAPAVADNEGDMVATLAAFADDDVESALVEINRFEADNCGIEHDEAEMTPPVNEPEDGAAVVEVVATDYDFEIPAVSAGRTSFVMTNAGAEAHFMLITRILQGTLEEAMSFDGDPEEAGLVEDIGDSGLAAPGGEDVEVLTGDLEPGTYGMLCFLPGPDGTPHAFMGMAVEFTVS